MATMTYKVYIANREELDRLNVEAVPAGYIWHRDRDAAIPEGFIGRTVVYYPGSVNSTASTANLCAGDKSNISVDDFIKTITGDNTADTQLPWRFKTEAELIAEFGAKWDETTAWDKYHIGRMAMLGAPLLDRMLSRLARNGRFIEDYSPEQDTDATALYCVQRRMITRAPVPPAKPNRTIGDLVDVTITRNYATTGSWTKSVINGILLDSNQQYTKRQTLRRRLIQNININ